MKRYTVLTGTDYFGDRYWTVYDRVARITLAHKPISKDDAQAYVDRLNASPTA